MSQLCGLHTQRTWQTPPPHICEVLQCLASKDAGQDSLAILLEDKSSEKMEAKWREHLCRIASRSLYPDKFPFEVEGSLPGQHKFTRPGRYGRVPNVMITPMPEGAYAIAWHDPNDQRIRVMARNANNEELYVLAPEFLKGARSLLGCAHTGRHNTYVIAYAKDHEVGGKAYAYHLCGFMADGTKIFDQLIFGDRPNKELSLIHI